MKRVLFLTLAILAVAALAGCAPGPNELTSSPNEQGQLAGFWLGLWHGFIVLFTFVLSLITDNVHIYEVHNSGGWYNCGFVLGVMFFFGGSGGGACRSSKHR